MVSYYDQVEREKSEKLVERVQRENLKLALVSDAGTPVIADPGHHLVKYATDQGVPVIPVPGPCALTTLASASPLPTERFLFVGFLPTKAAAMKTEMTTWAAASPTIIFYESPRRLEKTLEMLGEVYPNATITIGRELTKIHEEIKTFSIFDALIWVRNQEAIRGEVVVIVALNYEPKFGVVSAEQLADFAMSGFRAGKSLRDLLAELKDYPLPKGDVYQILLQAKKKYEGDGYE
jgi:16S rRNA (cytidine1402-2'-O)-methyltransferase